MRALLVAAALSASACSASSSPTSPFAFESSEASQAQAAEQQRARQAVDAFEAFLAVSRGTAPAPHWDVLTFYEVGPDQWAIRRASGDRTGPTGVLWAASPGCPDFLGALSRLEQIEAPLIDAPLVGWEHGDRIVVTADGIGYWLLARSFQNENVTTWSHLELGGNTGSSIGAWVEETMETLEPCWSETPPSSD